jgi:hypothetical protein
VPITTNVDKAHPTSDFQGEVTSPSDGKREKSLLPLMERGRSGTDI